MSPQCQVIKEEGKCGPACPERMAGRCCETLDDYLMGMITEEVEDNEL